MTLAFVGAVDANVQECLQAHAAEIEAERFLLRLAPIGHFARSRILWLGASACPHALAHLANELKDVLKRCGLRPEARPFHPHVTVLRNAEPAPAGLPRTAIEWQVDAFHLMESHTMSDGPKYEIVRTFSLRV
jgi:2'-5' RNA ligase